MSIKDQMQQDAGEYGLAGNSNFFRFDKSGKYTFRVLTQAYALATHFFGKGQPSHVCYGEPKGCPFHGAGAPQDEKGNEKKPSVKYVSYVLDRSDGRVKLAELPWSVWGATAKLEEDEDWAFNGFPMPYDLRVTFDKENKDPKQMYSVLGVPKREPLTVEEENSLLKALENGKPDDYVQKRKEKQLELHKANGIWDAEALRRKELGDQIAKAKGELNEAAMDYPQGDGHEPEF